MRRRLSVVWISIVVLLVAMSLAAPAVLASTTPVGIGAFGPGSTLTNFTGLADGTEVNGLVVGGIQFSYSLGNGQLTIDGGPGVTNNVNPPNIVSVGNNTGILTLLLPSSVDTFGYGYAILATTSVTNATTIALFQGVTPVGGGSYDGVLDPVFTGGFAGIQSTVLFDRVQLTFNSVAAPAFALDDIRTYTTQATTVPEPASLFLLGTGCSLLFLHWRKRSRT